jgi:hypothetical protein
MKLTLRHKDFCDGCEHLYDLHTLGQHKRCREYKKNFLPDESLFIATKQGYIKRPEICLKENEAEVRK